MESPMRKKDEIEVSLLKRFGLRISILEAWEDSLRQKGIMVPPGVSKALSKARVKVSSGCFTACDVGCDLVRVEASLVSTSATAGEDGTDAWMEMLAECMSENAAVEGPRREILFPAVKMHYNRFRFDGACGDCDKGETPEG